MLCDLGGLPRERVQQTQRSAEDFNHPRFSRVSVVFVSAADPLIC